MSRIDPDRRWLPHLLLILLGTAIGSVCCRRPTGSTWTENTPATTSTFTALQTKGSGATRSVSSTPSPSSSLALVGNSGTWPPPLTSVQLDTRGARAFVEFCEARNGDSPWSDADIHQMVNSPAYQLLVAHHSRMDAEVTTDGLTEMLSALQAGEPYTSASERLRSIYGAYRLACDQVAVLQKQTEHLVSPDLIQGAAAQAIDALPAQARLEATVYLLADGRSRAYVVEEEKAIVLDILQADTLRPQRFLAHEMHHIGADSLLPDPCPEPGLREALQEMTAMVQEGAATYLVDGWRGSPTAADFELVEAFLLDSLSSRLSGPELTSRRAELVAGQYGPTYQVGNEIIATLTQERGDARVKARLGDPVGLVQTWQRAVDPEIAFDQQIFLLLKAAADNEDCAAWLSSLR